MKINRDKFSKISWRAEYGLDILLGLSPNYKKCGFSSYSLEKCEKEYKDGPIWTKSACHSILNSSFSIQCPPKFPFIECRYRDIVSKRIANSSRTEFFAFTEHVYECFKPWLDMTYKEMTETHSDYAYVRIDISKISKHMTLGILNCMRGIEERFDVSLALEIVKEDFPDLTPAQQLIIAHILHPKEYPVRYYNTNHSIWLPQTAIDLYKIKDFSFLEEKRQLNTSWETMLPNGCYTNNNPLQKRNNLRSPGDQFCPLLSKTTVAYFLESSIKNCERINEHESAAAPCSSW
jgi:hypothetical protein